MMINIERYIELSDPVLRELATIQATSMEQWFAQAREITTLEDIQDFKTLWAELREYGSEIQYVQYRERDSSLNDCYDSRLQHVVILGQRIRQLAEQFGVEYR